MARKETPKKTTPTKTTPARNTPLPKPQAIKPTTAPMSAPAPKVIITHEMIAKRAFEISLSGRGDQMSHWLQAERELKGIR
jgi:hypothetical protein